MGKCRNCHTHFWGNPQFCPGCKTDLWYEEYHEGGFGFRELQEEGRRLIGKGNYEKAAVALKMALDQVMYQHAEHSMHRLRDAVSDFVWLYSNEAAQISDDRITDVLDYLEEECFGRDDRYRESLMALRRQVAKRLPEAGYREKQGLNFPDKREYWKLPPSASVTEQSSVSGYEPDILEAKHLLLAESFLYLFLNFQRVIKYLQAQESLNTQMVYEELLPLLHPDMDMQRHGENEPAKCFGEILCCLLEDGFEQLADLYLNAFDENQAEKLKECCGQIAVGLEEVSPSLLYMAILAPLLADEKSGEAVYRAAEPAVGQLLGQAEELHHTLAQTLDQKERGKLQLQISRLCAEYCCLYGVSQYRMALWAEADTERYLDAMELAAGNGITLAAEEMMRSYFYGRHGCEIQPGYAKFYSRLVSLRHIASSISDTIESVEDLEMMVPGTDISPDGR